MPRYQIPRSAEKSQEKEPPKEYTGDPPTVHQGKIKVRKVKDKEERTVIMSDAPIAPEGLKLLKVHKNPPTKS
jgi:hypothetical protein